MKKLLALAVLLAIGGLTFAQQATLNTPVVRNPEHNLRAESIYITRDLGGRWEAQVSVRDSGGEEIRRLVFSGPDALHPAATAMAFVTAYTTARAGETGGVVRRQDFRTLGFLADHNYITGVTLVP